MTFRLTLETPSDHALLPFNYQYPLSAAIYKIIQRGDAAYATFLHEQGYARPGSLKSFKLFCFSDIKTPFKKQGDCMHLLTRRAEVQISFHLPEAAENFIKGLFQSQHIEIADRKRKASFTIAAVETLLSPLINDEIQEVLLQVLSSVVCGKKNEKGHYDFLSPEQEDFLPMLLYNWKAKYQAVYGEQHLEKAFEGARMEYVPYKNPPKSRLITIKGESAQETKIRGFTNFQLKLRGKREALELLLNSGVGLYNAMGCGYVFMRNYKNI